MVEADEHSREGRVAVVTGAGGGIGGAITLALAKEGWTVFAVGRRVAPLEALAQSTENIRPLAADVTLDEDRRRIVRTSLETRGRLDLLVNNAGAFGLTPVEEMDEATLNRMLSVNLSAPLLLIGQALAALTASRGIIINVTSTMAHKPAPGILGYAAGKAALEHATRCLALELAPKGIRVLAVSPGPVETGVLAAAGLSESEAAKHRQAMREAVPLGRLGQPSEVAHWIAQLTGPNAGWITGHVLDVDGGYSVT